MRGNLKFRARSLATSLLACAALVAVAGLAGAAWDGTQDINLGDKVGAEFAVADPNHHEFSFWAPKDTILNIKAKAAPGLVLDFKLYDQLDAEQALGATVSAAGIKNFKIPADAYYTLHVSADSGSGTYLLTTTGKYPTKIVGTVSADTKFGAMAGALASASVKPSKTGAGAATITSVKLPGGTVAGVTAGVASFKNLALPKSTTYTLDLTFTTAGNVDVSIALKTKLVKRTFSFGICTVPPGAPVGIRADWLSSPHNRSADEAFRHWDADGAVPTSCAKCHSSGGYQDWLGADGTAFEVVNAAAATTTTVDCDACHNPVAATLNTAKFPSGDRLDNLGPEATCMQCHQGRESSVSMEDMITLSALGDDEVCTGSVPSGQAGAAGKLSFKNVHYFAAAATLYGREVRAGYQYAGKLYNGRLEHVDDYRTCVQCHDQHSTELRLNECASCHPGTTDYASLQNIRMERTVADYDGDGNVTEGIAGELSGLADTLYAAIQAYGSGLGTPITYDAHAYPYWFNDVTPRTGFSAWTPRLVRAAYNYQYYQKDPGAFAHNSRYTMQLLYDSLADLDASTYVAVANLSAMHRGDEGHFDATSLAFRDWDKAEGDSDGLVNINCAQCHSSEGFVSYATTVTSGTELSIVAPAPGVEGMRCESCHEAGAAAFSQAPPPVRYVPAVWFSSTKVGGTMKLVNGSLAKGEDANSNNVLDSGEDLDKDGLLDKTADPSFTCMTCHQGRQSKQTIDDYLLVQNTAPKPSSASFQNVHYLPAAGVLYANKAQVAYEYAGKTYANPFTHLDGGVTGFGPLNGNRCTYCHLTDHTFKPQVSAACATCHTEAAGDVGAIRKNRSADYDADGNATEHLSAEVDSFGEALYAAIRAYAQTTFGADKRIYYDGSSHPYWFYDTDGDGIKNSRGEDANSNGVLDAGEDLDGDKIFDSDWAQYPFWKNDTQHATAPGRMMKAAHNCQIWHKEPGAWAHNTAYIIQVLFDSIDDLDNGTLDGTIGTLPGGIGAPARP